MCSLFIVHEAREIYVELATRLCDSYGAAISSVDTVLDRVALTAGMASWQHWCERHLRVIRRVSGSLGRRDPPGFVLSVTAPVEWIDGLAQDLAAQFSIPLADLRETLAAWAYDRGDVQEDPKRIRPPSSTTLWERLVITYGVECRYADPNAYLDTAWPVLERLLSVPHPCAFEVLQAMRGGYHRGLYKAEYFSEPPELEARHTSRIPANIPEKWVELRLEGFVEQAAQLALQGMDQARVAGTSHLRLASLTRALAFAKVVLDEQHEDPATDAWSLVQAHAVKARVLLDPHHPSFDFRAGLAACVDADRIAMAATANYMGEREPRLPYYWPMDFLEGCDRAIVVWGAWLDMSVLASVLHESEEPERILQAVEPFVKAIPRISGIVYLPRKVPLHRQWMDLVDALPQIPPAQRMKHVRELTEHMRRRSERASERE